MERPGDQELEAEQRLLNDPLYQAAREPVLDLLRRLRNSESTEQRVMLHRDLLIEFGGRQDAADETLPRIKAQTRSEIRELAKIDPKPLDHIRAKQEILASVAEQTLVAKAIQHVLREVGDGLAWKALRFDRRAFAILGHGQRVGRLASGIGREAELEEIAHLWESEQALALHNDLTNCIRHGDLTVIREREGSINVTLTEVKAGQADAAPQLERLDRATRLLAEHRLISDDVDTPTLRVTVVPGEYETYLDELQPLLAEATRTGYAWMCPHPCLLVGAVDYRIWGTNVRHYSALSQRRRLEVGWPPEEPDTIGRTASMKRISDRRDNFPSIAPYTIFPLPPDQIADLIMGFTDLFVALNYKELETALMADEVYASVFRHPKSEIWFLNAQTETAGTMVPATLREQMMTELSTPDTLLRLIKHVLAQTEAHPEEKYDQRIVCYESELAAWGDPAADEVTE